jgi:hypothetical protein
MRTALETPLDQLTDTRTQNVPYEPPDTEAQATNSSTRCNHFGSSANAMPGTSQCSGSLWVLLNMFIEKLDAPLGRRTLSAWER